MGLIGINSRLSEVELTDPARAELGGLVVMGVARDDLYGLWYYTPVKTVI